MNESSTVLHAVSMFSNCGAGDLGYSQAGFSFDVMAEIDPRRLEVSLLNHPNAIGVPGDLRVTWPEVASSYEQITGSEPLSLLAACPPCQGMSSVKRHRGLACDPVSGSRDQRNLLVVVIGEVATKLRPKVVVVENVPAFLTRKVCHPTTGAAVSAANLLVSLLDREYVPFPFVVDLCEYGVPQTRKRTFLTFVRRDLIGLERLLRENRAPYPRPTHAHGYGDEAPITVGNALRSFELPALDASSELLATTNVGNGLHRVPVWRDRRYDMVAAIPPGSGASAWETDRCYGCGGICADPEAAICPNCLQPLLRPVTVAEQGQYRLVRGFRSSSYRRMSPNDPAATVTTASGRIGSSRTIHPFENRVFSVLECAYLQTFPPEFDWGHSLEKWGHTNVRAMIGEAVPPRFTHLHGAALVGVLTDEWSVAPISNSDPRCSRARKVLGL